MTTLSVRRCWPLSVTFGRMPERTWFAFSTAWAAALAAEQHREVDALRRRQGLFERERRGFCREQPGCKRENDTTKYKARETNHGWIEQIAR